MIALSTQTKRRLLLIGALIVAGLIAFPLRKLIYGSVVVPVAFVAWNLNLLYRSLSQAIWWAVITGIVLFMLLFSLIPQPKFRRAVQVKPRRQLGQVEDLAAALQKAERGIYFKWLVANRLGKLAYQILLHRESGRPRSLFAPLAGTDWEPTQELQKYLETGLHGSFADFPHVNRPFRAPQKTPLDVKISEAVEFLESQVENGQLSRQDIDLER
jgi:hypothetical protein